MGERGARQIPDRSQSAEAQTQVDVLYAELISLVPSSSLFESLVPHQQRRRRELREIGFSLGIERAIAIAAVVAGKDAQPVGEKQDALVKNDAERRQPPAGVLGFAVLADEFRAGGDVRRVIVEIADERSDCARMGQRVVVQKEEVA